MISLKAPAEAKNEKVNDSVSWLCCALESKKFDVTVNLELKGKKTTILTNMGYDFSWTICFL